MPHPYLGFIQSETARSDADLVAIRNRLVSIITTSTSVLTVVGAVTVLGPRLAGQTATSVPLPSAVLLTVGVAFLLLSAVIGVRGLAGTTIKDGPGDLTQLTSVEAWTLTTQSDEYERRIAEALAGYRNSLVEAASTLSVVLTYGARTLTLGIFSAGVAVVWAAFSWAVG